jgi:hypothetical protein
MAVRSHDIAIEFHKATMASEIIFYKAGWLIGAPGRMFEGTV